MQYHRHRAIMPIDVSISAAIAIIIGTLTLYSQLKEAPQELRSARRNVDRMRTALVLLNDTLNDKKSFLSRQPAM